MHDKQSFVVSTPMQSREWVDLTPVNKFKFIPYPQGVASIQKEDPSVLRDDEFAIPRSKLQLDRRNSFSPCSSEAPRRRPPFEFRRPKVPAPRAKVPDHK